MGQITVAERLEAINRIETERANLWTGRHSLAHQARDEFPPDHAGEREWEEWMGQLMTIEGALGDPEYGYRLTRDTELYNEACEHLAAIAAERQAEANAAQAAAIHAQSCGKCFTLHRPEVECH